MSEDQSPDMSQIECTVEKSNINEHKRVYINVKGQTLDECRKHFNEIKRGVESE